MTAESCAKIETRADRIEIDFVKMCQNLLFYNFKQKQMINFIMPQFLKNSL